MMIMFECTLCGICCIAYVWLMLLINHEFICLLFLLFFFVFFFFGLFYILCKCNLLNVQNLMEMIMLCKTRFIFIWFSISIAFLSFLLFCLFCFFIINYIQDLNKFFQESIQFVLLTKMLRVLRTLKDNLLYSLCFLYFLISLLETFEI